MSFILTYAGISCTLESKEQGRDAPAGEGANMRFVEKWPMVMIVLGVAGISLSSIFVKFSTAPAAVIFAQIPGVMQLIGGAMILGGVFWYSRIEGKETEK